MNNAAQVPTIPEFITVHLGSPDSAAENVTLSFPEYIKNVASSEIFPTWPQEALKANIYAQTSFALNRIFTEWYRSRGYDFDITASTGYDQKFIKDRIIFDNISDLVDAQFNSYIVRGNNIEPLFAAYCDGVEVICSGLSQTGSAQLAAQGLSAIEILRRYYGSDINIIENAPVAVLSPSYPGTALRRGDFGTQVQQLQIRLNRISRNYPYIPKINPADGSFGASTEAAVRAFQETFGLPVDGIVGLATWYRIAYIYTSVKRLAELDSEGLIQSELPQQFPGTLSPGDSGNFVRSLQYYLAVVGDFYPEVRPISISGVYDRDTTDAVKDFQTLAGLPADGIVGINTWRALYGAYTGIILTENSIEGGVAFFPGTTLALGSQGEDVLLIQQYLQRISQSISQVPSIVPDGVFGRQTEQAVLAVQRLFGLEETGGVGPLTWTAIASLYSDLTVGENRRQGQFGGAIGT